LEGPEWEADSGESTEWLPDSDSDSDSSETDSDYTSSGSDEVYSELGERSEPVEVEADDGGVNGREGETLNQQCEGDGIGETADADAASATSDAGSDESDDMMPGIISPEVDGPNWIRLDGGLVYRRATAWRVWGARSEVPEELLREQHTLVPSFTPRPFTSLLQRS
jgi:hypothetical protein